VAQLWQPATQPEELLSYVTHHYLTSLHVFGMIFSAMLLLEGLALLLYAAHCCRTQADFGWRLARMLVISACAAATFNLWFFVNELTETGAPAAHFADFFLRQRWSAHVSDMNAAGSFFVMTMFTALGLAFGNRVQRMAWIGAGGVIGLAMWMTSSRTALAAAALVGMAWAARALIRRPASRRHVAAAVVAVSVLALAAQYLFTRSSNIAPSEAVNVRWMFLDTTWQMLKAHPLFGVGIGQYADESAHFSSPVLLAIYPREHAHNNFAQVAGELGLVGFGVFLAIRRSVLAPRPRAPPSPGGVPVLPVSASS
jgi:O-antigen ligase